MTKYLAIALLAAISGCATEKNFTKFHEKKEAKAAEHCGTWYPIKTSTKTIIKNVPGKPTVTYLPGETVYVDCAEAVTSALDEASKKHVAVKCPPIRTVETHDTTYIHDTTIEENTALLRACQLQKDAIAGDLSKKITEADNYKEEKRSWEGRALWTWGILFVLLIVLALLKYCRVLP